MTQDNEFEPKLGKIRSTSSRSPRFLGEVLKTTARAGRVSASPRSRFTGARTGRGSGVGRVLSLRDRSPTSPSRRVVIKTRIVRLKGGLASTKLHLRYLQRNGVTRDGAPGELYSSEHDRADGKSFLELAQGDRHQFRFIVSADDAEQYDDLKTVTRRLMRRMQADLGTALDWVAVDHYDTAHPHSHVIVRGKDDRSRDLIIARDYIRFGLRERACELVTLDLGPRTERDIAKSLRAEIAQERFTSLDRSLLRDAKGDNLVRSSIDTHDGFRQTLRAGRLQKLKKLGLAREIAPGTWQLAEDMQTVLQSLGERGDIIKAMHHQMQRNGVDRLFSDYAIYDPADPNNGQIIGRVLALGSADEMGERQYLILDGVDGRSHYVDIGESPEPVAQGSLVAVSPRSVAVRMVDRTVAEIAAAHAGRYNIDIHLRHDPAATQSVAEAHVRRLEALQRHQALVAREPDGTWIIAADHLGRAWDYERAQARRRPAILQTLATLPLERQVCVAAATWLDRELLAKDPIAVCDRGFGKELRAALVRRQDWLIAQHLARREHGQIVYPANLLARLRQRELRRVAAALSNELGLSYVETQSGMPVDGIYRRKLDLVSGPYALIENGRAFTLVPWQATLERSLGRGVSSIARGETISFGRGRGGPAIA